MFYSFIGWFMEVACKYFEQRKFVNRGFLLGPICPIYGYGVILIILLIGSSNNDILSIFLKSILICSVLEYLTSYIMEKIFKARWWDYSQKKFNINGRICLETMLPFGIMGSLVVYFLHPKIIFLVGKINYTVKLCLALFMLAVYIIDNIISFNVMSKIRIQIKKTKEDNTTAIKKKVIEWINANSFWYRRITKAFPKFKIMDKVKRLTNVVKKDKNTQKEM
jgi:uncharacterized membrane protein